MRDKVKPLSIYFIFLILVVLFFTQKSNYFVDELWSYGLANSTSPSVMDIENGKTYSDTGEPFLNYYTASEESAFHYRNVWENQKKDNHPVLYYLVLHTISSFFPGKFSMWFGASINLVCSIVLLFFLRKLILLLTHSQRIQNIVSLGFVFTYGVINAMGFIRMYAMVMCWGLILSYLILRIVDQSLLKPVPTGLNDHSKWYLYFCAVAVTMFGALTQYYFIIYAVLLTLTTTVCLVLHKKYQASITLLGTEICGCLLALCVFPTMIKHLFGHDRGAQTMENLSESSSDFDHMIEFWHFLNREMFGGLMLFAVGIIAVSFLLYYVDQSKKHDWEVSWYYYWILLIPVTVYFLFISISAPLQANRYLFLIYPVSFVIVFGCLSTMVAYLLQNNSKLISIVISFVMVITVIFSYVSNAQDLFPYLYKESPKQMAIAKQYSDLDCLVIYRYGFQKLPLYLEASSFKSITFVHTDELAMLDEIDIAKNDELILINVCERPGDANVDRVFHHCPQFTKCVTLFESHLEAETCHLY